MDPHNGEFEGYGEDPAPRRDPARDPLATSPGQPGPARVERLVCGEYLVTVNPVDGSEIELCPPGERPARPVKLGPEERERRGAPAAPLPPSAAPAPGPLLRREEERELLGRLLAQGRSIRLTGPAGSGRSSLLDAVAEDCAGLAPDGVVRLSGHQRTAQDLWYDLFAAVYGPAPGDRTQGKYRPDRGPLLELLQDIGAIVVLDDLELGGPALDDLLAAAPECAFLMAATPDVPEPSAASGIEEVALGGLDSAACLDLLAQSVGRGLTEEEATWAGDLWFESEGLPLRFVQAAALLRQRDRLLAGPGQADEYGAQLPVELDAFGVPRPPDDLVFAARVPLPTLGEGAAPAALLASRLSESAREALRFAVVLGGEVPHPAHLPALVGDTHADAALAELVDAALVAPVGGRHRLVAGVLGQLTAAGYAAGAEVRAHTAARHYAWWSGHPSVTPDRVAAESGALLAALAAVLPQPGAAPSGSDEGPHVAVDLARTAAPALAAALDWGAWERLLRRGQEAARLTGEVAEDAYFHHELGILALCSGHPDLARTELEASIGLRGALADKRGTVAGRRALALVADRTGSLPGVLQLPPDEGTLALQAGSGGGAAGGGATGRASVVAPVPVPGRGAGPTPALGVPRAAEPDETPLEPVTLAPGGTGAGAGAGAVAAAGGGGRRGGRRGLVGAGAGVLLVAVLGTVVALGVLSREEDEVPDRVSTDPTATEQVAEPSYPDETEPTPTRSEPAEETEPSESASPSSSESASPSPSESESESTSPSPTPTSESPSSSQPPTTTRPPTPTEPPTSEPPTPTEPPTSPDPEPTPSSTPPSEPGTTNSATGPSSPMATGSRTPPEQSQEPSPA